MKLTRKEQAQITRRRIIDALENLMDQYDYEDISIEMITNQAGIAKGSFYVYFKSKKALSAVIVAEKVTKVDMDYQLFFKDLSQEMTSYDHVLKLTHKIARVMQDDIGHKNMSVVYEALLDESIDASAVSAYNRKIYEVISEIVDRGIRSQEFKDEFSPLEISKHIMLALRGLTYQWCVMYPNFDLIKTTEEHMDLLLRGLLR